MPKLRYVGPIDEIEIAATGQVVKRDGTVEVTQQLAASLLEQPENWERAGSKTSTSEEGEQ